MGIFGSKKKTYVDTSVIRIVEDNHVTDLRKSSIIESIFEGGSPTDLFIENMLNSPTFRYERAYSYAERGDYFYGLPNATVLTNTTGHDLVQAVIEAEIGYPITLEYLEFAQLNNTHMGWQEIMENYGYDVETNELTVLSAQEGFTVYLDKLVAVHQMPDGELPEPGAWNTWGTSSLAGQTDDRRYVYNHVVHPEYKAGPTLTESVEIHYIWENNGPQTGMIVLDLSGFEDDREYFQARYRYIDGNSDTQYGYWTYLAGEGTHPTLDAIHDVQYTNPGTYFPFGVFRTRKQNRADPTLWETDEFLTTKKLMKYYGIDFVQVSDKIHENPDIADVEQAVVMMAVPANSQNQTDIAYLYEFFLQLHAQTPYNEASSEINGSPPYDPTEVGSTTRKKDRQEQNRPTPPRAAHALVIQDADFKLTLSYGGVVRTVRAGVIGPVGFYTNVEDTTIYATSYYLPDGAHGTKNVSKGINRVYKKQLNETMYEELIVIDPTLRYSIYKSYGTMGGAKSGDLLIPIDKAIADRFQVIDKSILYPRSLHFVFNSRVTQKLEWYQTGLFKFILIVIVVVITIVTGGAGSGLSGLIAAIGAGTVATALYLLKLIVYRLITMQVFKLVVRKIGAEAALMLAVVTAAMGLSNVKDFGMATDALWGDNLLLLSNGLISGIGSELNDRYEDLADSYASFEEYKEDALAELERGQNLLENDSLLSPFVLFGEKPEEYYNRTIHAGNIGVTGIEFVESYVSASLTLPDINTTLGGTI